MNKTCASRGFKALMVTQFLGAFNDNLFKIILNLMVANTIVEEQGSILELILIGVCFNLPFILFSASAGSLSDRFSKATIARATKLMEMVVMGLGMVFIAHHNVYALLVVLFLMGTHSAFFSPAKYGVLPELLDEGHISRGNGYIEFWTFGAIIGGTALGGVLTTFLGTDSFAPGMVMIGIAACGLAASFFITKIPAANSQAKFVYNPLHVLDALSEIRANTALLQTVVGIAFFWSVGSLYQMNIPLYAKELGGLSDLQTSLLLAVLGMGIGLGSISAGAVSAGKVELGLVPVGAAGISLSSVLLCYSYESYFMTLLFVLALGLSSGFFIVPLQSFLQEESPQEKRGSYIAASNFVSFLSMLVFSFLLLVLVDFLGLTPAEVFLVFGLATIAVVAYICTVLPQMLVRCINWLLIHSLYKVKVVGEENVPADGGALLVCNHVSFIDPPLVLAALGRNVRFLMFRPIYEARLIKPIAKTMGAIPVGASIKREDVTAPLNEAREAIKNGELAGIFAEGAITRIGQMLKFKKGLERIMDGVDAPIIPVHIDQVWGSIFSFKEGRVFWKRPKTMPYPVTVSFGKPLPANASGYEVRQAVQELGAEAFHLRRDAFQVLHRGFVKSCKRSPFRVAVADSSGTKLRAATLLASSLAGACWLKNKVGSAEMVGVYLPPSVAGVIANVALLIAGKVPVNLNYTAGTHAQASAVKQCKLTAIVTSRRMLEKIPFMGQSPEEGKGADRPEFVYLEDLEPALSKGKKFGFYIASLLLPLYAIEKLFFARQCSRDDIATVIFSSGSTGEPKGVMLSHGNVSANITSIYDVYSFGKNDCLVGVLPFFHSFGFTGTLWLPLLGGFKAVYHNNPMDGGVIGKLVQDHEGTMLMSTPTFLLAYIRRCEAEQFATLKYVLTGAEKLKERVADAFAEKFGVLPKEGYGCTELSPLAIANVQSFEEKGLLQVGQKLGTVGHPIPGVAVRIVDPETYQLRKPGEDGLLLIKGANVMLGYLGAPEKTKEVIRDGWYVTGDIARVDEDGFVIITDRLSRFSKIGGEMVPHMKVEEEIHSVLGETETVCVVTSVPDDKKGEKLVVLSTKPIDAAYIAKQLSAKGIPNLWIPSPANYYQVETLPLLGSGKLDLRTIKTLALEKTQQA
jgi:acyl-[acyl-carrier-protein]-phospholipid O-acyltransferase / long-chain-fatty-acid--[acyl-carrier-protein] ligase